jgi:UDP-2,4-diacetamido-2,4,6-trideoxy-beta-L-altropyranose hydrolase
MLLDQMRSVIFRADANAEIGLGHVMRMSSLAAECRKNGWQTQFCGNMPERLSAALAADGHGPVPVKTTRAGELESALLDAIHTTGTRPWVVLDGYGFDEAYQQRIFAEGARVMVMDDHCHLPSYASDLTVNQNAGAEHYPYILSRDGLLLCGTPYVLLRKEFTRWRAWQRAYPSAGRRLLLTVGGADPGGLALDWLAALESHCGDALEIHLLAGTDNPRQQDLESLARRSRHQITLSLLVEDMASLMAWADVALTAGGSTLWESAFMSLPAVVVCLADNQRGGTRAVADAGAAVFLGERDGVALDQMAAEVFQLVGNRTARAGMGLAGRKLVDGRGAERVRLAMEALS